jgi:hypothetical protein
MAATALEYYMTPDYKNCLRYRQFVRITVILLSLPHPSELAKIKSNKNSQDKGFFRILNNIAVAEYVSDKNRKVNDFLNKMGKISPSVD